VAIVTQCPDCGKKLKASEAQVGKKAKCPACQKPFEIKPIDGGGGGEQKVTAPNAVPQKASAATSAPAPKRPSSAGSAVKPREDWYLQTADGEEYGPVSRSELDEWLAEGRIDNECQLLREGWEQWKWAEEIFPQLANGSGGGGAADDNPFAGLGAEQPAADPFTGIAPSGGAAANPYSSPAASASVEPVGSGGGGEITQGTKNALRQHKPWIMLFMILSGLATALMALMLMLSILAIFAEPISGIINFLFGSLYFGMYGYMTFLFYKFFESLANFERSPNSQTLEKSMIASRNFWRFAGILTLVGIGLAVLMIVLMIVLVGGIAAVGASQF